MAALGTSEWLFVGAGWVSVLGAGVLLAWALFWDRPRGRRRCRKCWYDMSGAPGLRCPECGREARREGGLFRTRRRWGWAGVATYLLVAGWCIGQAPAYRDGGVWAAVPRPVVIWMMPRVSMDAGRGQPPVQSLEVQLEQRVFGGAWELARLWWPERWLLERRSRQVLENGGTNAAAKVVAARALVILRADAVEAVAREHAAPVILAKCLLTYAQATTYWDRGIAMHHHGEARFARAFARDEGGNHRFRSEREEREQLGGSEVRWVIWDDGATGYAWDSTSGRRRILPAEQVLKFLDSFLVLHDALLPPIRLSGDAELIEMELVNGRMCYHIAPRRLGEVWIDSETFLLVQSSIGASMVSTFEPHLDVRIDESWFTEGPPHAAWWLLDAVDASEPVPRQ